MAEIRAVAKVNKVGGQSTRSNVGGTVHARQNGGGDSPRASLTRLAWDSPPVINSAWDSPPGIIAQKLLERCPSIIDARRQSTDRLGHDGQVSSCRIPGFLLDPFSNTRYGFDTVTGVKARCIDLMFEPLPVREVLFRTRVSARTCRAAG